MKMHTVNGSKQIDCCDNNEQFRIDTSGRMNCISEKIPARLVLYFLSWSGFLVSFMMRNDINFALLAMVRTNTTTTTTTTTTTAAATAVATTTTTGIDSNLNSTTNIIDDTLNYTKATTIYNFDFNNTTTTTNLENIINFFNSSDFNYNNYNNSNNILNLTTTTSSIFIEDNKNLISNSIELNINNNFEDLGGEYEWSSTVKASILGSFYWCYVLSQVVGGVATQHFGTKNVFGWSQFATAICSLFIPYASDIHYGAVIFLRSIQGFCSGLTWPAMYGIVACWIPEMERSRFMSSFQGFSIGIGLTYPLCGFIIKNFGWRYIFYTTGTIGCLWTIMWYFLAFNTPDEHPRITKSELIYITKNISKEIKNAHGMKVPWLNIFKSLPAWSIGVTTFGRIWIHYQFIMSGPNYMKNILGFSIQSNGLLSGLPFLFSYIASVTFCYLADYLCAKNWMSLTNVRKTFTAISQILPGIILLLIGYITDNIIAVLIIWFIAVTLITAAYAGAMANVVDIAPNLAGPVLAFAQTIHMTASFLSPVVTGFIVTNEKSISQWRTVFGISLIIAFCTYIMFQIYGTAKIQSWNFPRNKLLNDESEILPTSQHNIMEDEQHSGDLIENDGGNCSCSSTTVDVLDEIAEEKSLANELNHNKKI